MYIVYHEPNSKLIKFIIKNMLTFGSSFRSFKLLNYLAENITLL